MFLKKETEEIKERKERKADPQWQIIFTGAAVSLLFVALGLYFVLYAWTNRVSLASNNYNRRQRVYAEENVRGDVIASDGTVLATTETQGGAEARVYPFGELYAHAVGYTGRGKAGVEAEANYYLSRSDISVAKKIAGDGEKYPGNSVVMTIVPSLQKAAYDALGANRGAVIVTKAGTGEVLALVSKPSFDPNTVASFYDSYVADETNTVLLNRVTQGLYPPGSTFKIVTALAYLKEHGGSGDGFHFTCTGSFTSGSDTIRCYHSQVHGEVGFPEAFAKSCNSAFASMGLSLGRNTFASTLKELKFNAALPLDGSYNASSAKVDSATSDTDLIQLSIGQGETLMTPMHLNLITGAIANRGVMMKPYDIDRVMNADGDVIKRFSAGKGTRVMSAEDADTLKTLMKGVVETGTGTGLKGASYTAAGKTGSAEFSTATKESHAWFTGFAPAEDPELVITVVMENAGSGGAAAVPVAKKVFDTWFR